MVVLDTDVLIELSRGNKAIVEKVIELQRIEPLAITIFSAEELLLGLQALEIKERLQQAAELLKKFKIFDYTQKELNAVVELKFKLKKTGKTIGKYDECIAGVCIAKNEALFSLNRKHFERIKELKLI